ncbi:GNAT family N-acetyltransferase [Gordonia sp. CPCC 205515]|uniref:GNAT family N-acetyltransferase n=1 Tax=Gordonia sp. CPCC 205515 TaxID=3140791 RepID=UPI003AF3816D
MTIEPLTTADRDEWLPLWRGYLEFYRHSLSDEQTALTFNRILDPGFAMWGAIARDDAGRAVGFVHWLTHSSTWSEAPYCYLEDLFVAPDARTSGTGRALIEHVTNWASTQGIPKVYWQTAVDNSTARGLYDKVATTGFVVYEIDLPA